MSISKVELSNGTVLMDATGASVTPDTLADGVTAMNAAGEMIVGVMKTVDIANYYTKTEVDEAINAIKLLPGPAGANGTQIHYAGYGTAQQPDVQGDDEDDVWFYIEDVTVNGDEVRYGDYVLYDGALYSVVSNFNVARVSATLVAELKGPPGSPGVTPVKGTDYWTPADKAEMVNDVLKALPTWTGGSY